MLGTFPISGCVLLSASRLARVVVRERAGPIGGQVELDMDQRSVGLFELEVRV